MDASIYSQDKVVAAELVAMNGLLRPSALYTLFQIAATEDVERYGLGETETRDKGIVWMVVHMRAEILRMPAYLEKITVSTWTGKTSHGMFIRHYELLSESGESLVRACGTWTLVDIDSRSMLLSPPFSFENLVTGREIATPKRLRLPELEHTLQFIPTYSLADINRHVNNTKYLDIAEDLMPLDYLQDHMLKYAAVDYLNEVIPGKALEIKWSHDDNTWYFEGIDEKPCFRIKLVYE